MSVKPSNTVDHVRDITPGPVVELRAAVCLLGRFPALAGVDLDVAAGEVLLLRGPNGAGKSTLLRLCAGLSGLTSGTGLVLGQDLNNRGQRRQLRREIGLLSHATALYDELTVEQNIRFWVAANRSEESMIEPVMERFGLAGRLRSVGVSGLSAGQRRRVSLAIVVCRRPRLWLLDEPHSGLDSAGRKLIDDLVIQASEAGATVIVASHEVERVAELAARTVVIAGGRIVSDDTALDDTASSPESGPDNVS